MKEIDEKLQGKKLKVENIKEFCNELNEYLKSTFRYKKDFAYVHGTNIYAKSAKFDLMIRFFLSLPKVQKCCNCCKNWV